MVAAQRVRQASVSTVFNVGTIAPATISHSGDPAMEALKRDSPRAAREADPISYLGDGADVGEFLLVPRNEQDLVLLARLDCKGH